jgi:hypothetical protein
MTEIIKLNIGGDHFTTSKSTLMKHEPTMLSTMFSSSNFKLTTDSEGYYFIDRNGKYFEYILKFLRDDKVNIEHLKKHQINDLIDEANFYMLESLINYINHHYSNDSKLKRDSNIEKYILGESGINIGEFEREFNEIFSVDNINLLRTSYDKRDGLRYADKDEVDGFYYTLLWELETGNQTPSEANHTPLKKNFYNFMKRYTSVNKGIRNNPVINFNNLDKILTKLNNHQSNLFRTPFKDIKLTLQNDIRLWLYFYL